MSGREHNISALQIAVNNAGLMNGVQPIAKLQRDHLRLLPPQRPFVPNAIRKRCSFKEFHSEKCGRPQSSLARKNKQFVNATNMWAHDPACKLHLLVKSLEHPRIAGDVGTYGFESYHLPQFQIRRLVDLAHTPSAE